MTGGPATPRLAVSFDPGGQGRALLAEILAGTAEAAYIAGLDDAARAAVLRDSAVLLTRNTARELRPQELALLRGMKLVQFLSAGLDFIPLADLPPEVPVANNAGAYAEPMAEHAVALALAAAKRLLVEHGNLAEGRFNQGTMNRMLAGSVCGIFGFGGIGQATGRLMHCLGMRVHAINRRGATPEPVEWIGTPDRLPALLAAADVLVISAPLTPATRGVIDARALSLMKPDAILVNLARGEIIEEAALYRHLLANPGFTACLDAWWVEPVRHGAFRMDHPFLALPNVIGSPHNSASVASSSEAGLRHAAENCLRVLLGEAALNLVRPEDRMM
jgi:glycerate dehydrogenase